MFVIKRANKYVALPGSEKSYTQNFDKAQKFSSREAAEANACGNERVVALQVGWVYP